MSRRFSFATVAATAALALAATAAVQATAGPRDSGAGDAKPARQCFSASRIANWARASDSVVNLRVAGGGYYQVALAGQCLKAVSANQVTMTFKTDSGDDVCAPLDLDVVVSNGGVPITCGVDSLRRLSPEEVAALPSKQKP